MVQCSGLPLTTKTKLTTTIGACGVGVGWRGGWGDESRVVVVGCTLTGMPCCVGVCMVIDILNHSGYIHSGYISDLYCTYTSIQLHLTCNTTSHTTHTHTSYPPPHRAYFNQRIGDEWLSIRLDLVGASITFMAALLAVCVVLSIGVCCGAVVCCCILQCF